MTVFRDPIGAGPAGHGASVLHMLAVFVLVLAPAAAWSKEMPASFADLAERVLPAVVNISTTQVVPRGDGVIPDMPQFPPGSPFEEFFKDFFDRQGRPDAPPRRVTSLGSGFVIDPSGFIVTNNHVIKDADEIVVRFQDETTLVAKIIGHDNKTDVALLKVDSDKPLPALKFGDSDASRVGDWVIAIGNPFGLGGSVTAGIISARKRDINSGPYDEFLQTDASINKGNSGGPMVNLDGDVVGINTAIFSPSGGSVGIGFAVPSSLAATIVDQLRKYGRTRRGWLGVRIQTVTDEIAESLSLGEARGALVASVTEGGPAATAGIEPGDIVLTFDGRPVPKMRQLPRVVAETEIDKSVPVEVWRKGKLQTVMVKVGELEESEVETAEGRPEEGGGPGAAKVAALGIAAAAVDDELRRRFGLAESIKGVVITEVDPAGPGAEKDLKPGDVIVEVNQEAVASPAEVARKAAEAEGSGRKSVLLLVDRKGDLRFVAVMVGKPQGRD